MRYLGDFEAAAIVYAYFNTRTAAGAPITLAGSPAASVYKSDNTTQTTTGVTLSVDFDSRTGLHVVKVDTADAFYATGTDFHIVLTAGTVDSISAVGAVVGGFSIENRTGGGTVPTAIENADALLARDIGSGSLAGTLDERTVRAALRFMRNQWTVAGSTLTVKKEDDSTTAWTAAVSTTAGDPVTGINPT
jgi:hypothetical protein